MDRTILVLEQHETNPPTNIGDRENYYVREAVRAVLSDTSGKIALLYAKQRDYYKLPGGGIDEGEDFYAALNRELMEEAGSKAEIIEELGQVVEWRDYRKMKQISYAFKASLVGEPGEPDFTQSEIDEGFEIKWVDNLDLAIDLVDAKTTHEDLAVVFMCKRDVAILRSAA